MYSYQRSELIPVSILRLSEEVVNMHPNQPYIELREDSFEFEKTLLGGFNGNFNYKDHGVKIKRLEIRPINFSFQNESDRFKDQEYHTNTAYLALDPKIEEYIKVSIGYYTISEELDMVKSECAKLKCKNKHQDMELEKFSDTQSSFWKRLKFLFTAKV